MIEQTFDPVPLLTSTECAALLGLSRRFFNYLAASGRFAVAIVFSPRVRRWRREDVVAWVAESQAAERRRMDAILGKADPATFRVPRQMRDGQS